MNLKIKRIIIPTIIILIFILTFITVAFIKKVKVSHQSLMIHQNIDIKTTSSTFPYKYYKIYLYVDDEDNWESETFYYSFLEEPNDSFFGKAIYFEDEKLDLSIFEKYNILAFAKISNYSFTLDNYYLSDSCKLEFTLNESAIYENFQYSNYYAFGGIILIPKSQPINDIDIFLNYKSGNDNYIINKKSVNKPYDYYKNYSEKLIDKDIIKEFNFTAIEDFYIKLITTKEELQKISKKLKFINDIELLNYVYSNLFLYRNVLLCARNSNGEFYCEPQIEKDLYYQDIWNVESLNITEYFYNTSQKDYITYYSLIPLTKMISLENINIEKKELNLQNFEDTKFKINLKTAEKIAQNHFKVTTSLSSDSFLEIFNLNILKNSNLKESIENPYYKRMCYFRDEYFNEIYIDASTGEIFNSSL